MNAMNMSLQHSNIDDKENRATWRWSRFSSGWNWSCPNDECQEFGIKANVNVVVAKIYGKRRIRLLRCRTCQTTFSERRFSPFYGSHADENLILEAMYHLAQGRSIRTVARTLGVDKDTICRWLDKAAQASDEIRTFLAGVLPEGATIDNFIINLEKRKSTQLVS